MNGHHIKTPQQVKEEFSRAGVSISGWAREHGFPREYVHQILTGKRKCNIGTGHRIAVLLGIKNGEIIES